MNKLSLLKICPPPQLFHNVYCKTSTTFAIQSTPSLSAKTEDCSQVDAGVAVGRLTVRRVTITETLTTAVRVVLLQAKIAIQTLVAVLTNHVFLASTLPVFVALEIV